MRTRRALVAVLSVVAGAVAIYWRSEAILQYDYSVPPGEVAFAVEPSSGSLADGKHIAIAIAQCQFCHGADLAGAQVIDDPWLGRLYAANLTGGEGGIGSIYTDAAWLRAIRFGVGQDGHSLLLQPSEHLSAMSDNDLAAVITFLRQVPAVDTHHPPMRIGPLIRLGLALGLTPDLISASSVDRARKAPRDVRVERSAAYGAYLTEIGNCRFCHHGDLRGGLHPLARAGEPVPPDLRREGSMAEWTREDFVRAMREGRTPDGRRLDSDFMPWPGYAGLSDLEVEALWLYLRDL